MDLALHPTAVLTVEYEEERVTRILVMFSDVGS